MVAGTSTLKLDAQESIVTRVSRARLVLVTLSVALFGVAGCGGDSATPPVTEPAASAPASPAEGGGATPVSDTGGGGESSISKDIETERVAAKRALRKWGKGAERACRKAERRIEPWVDRLKALKPAKGHRMSSGEIRTVGKRIAEYARAAEYEYAALQAVALPTQAAAVDQIESFFDKEEEALMLILRLGVELQAMNDLEAYITTLDRLHRLTDDYKRAGRSVGALSCVDSD
jgi:hypothetical protein